MYRIISAFYLMLIFYSQSSIADVQPSAQDMAYEARRAERLTTEYLWQRVIDNYPTSIWAEIARGRLADFEFKYDKALTHYENVISKRDDIPMVYLFKSLNLNRKGDKKGRYQALEKAAQLDAQYGSELPGKYIGNWALYYQDELNDLNKYNDIVERLLNGNDRQKMVGHYLMAENLKSNGNSSEALRHIELSFGIDVNIRNYTTYFSIIDSLYRHKGDRELLTKQVAVHEKLSTVVAVNPDKQHLINESLLMLANTVSTFKSQSPDLQLYFLQNAIEFDPDLKTVIAYSNFSRQYFDPKTTVEVLKNALNRYPNASALYEQLGHLYAFSIHDANYAIEYYQKALQHALYYNSPRLTYRVASGARYIGASENAYTLIMKNAAEYRNKNSFRASIFYKALLLNLMDQNRWEEAKKIRDEAIKSYPERETENFYALLNIRLELALDAKAKKTKYYRDNPFLQEWDKLFDQGLSLNINFATNSSVIPKGDFNALDKAAKILKQANAANYIFRVEGHTDASGNDKINVPLSKKRAEAVKTYFVEKHGIDSGRIQPVGFGARRPLANNKTNTGKTKNRRVEIRPMGSIADPRLATLAPLETEAVAISDDGRYMATGYAPVTLWDTERQVRLRSLAWTGGKTRSFSPNNRYLAVSSSATLSNGVNVKALYINDTKTGILEHQYSFENGVYATKRIDSIAWSPFSNQLAFMTDHGSIHIYDLSTKKIVAVNKPIGVPITGELYWTKDGKNIVVAKQRDTKLHVYNASDLSHVKSVDGVNWPHAIGETGDSNHVIVANNDRTLSIFSAKDFSLVTRVRNPTQIPSSIQSVPGTDYLIFDQKFGDENSVSLVDWREVQLVNKWDFDGSVKAAVSPDGTSVTLVAGEKVHSVNLSNFEKSEILQANVNSPKGLLHDQVNNYLISQDSSGAVVWKIDEGKRIHSIDKVNAIPWSGLGANSDKFVSFSESGKMLIYNSANFSIDTLPGIQSEPYLISSNEKFIAVASREFGTKMRPQEYESITIFDAKSFARITELRVKLVTEKLRYQGGVVEGGIKNIAISDELVAVSTWWNNGNFKTLDSKDFQVFEIESGERLTAHDTSLWWPIRSLAFDTSNKQEIIVQAGRFEQKYNLKLKKYSPAEPIGLKTISLEEGPDLNYDDQKLVRGNLVVPIDGLFKDIVFDESKNLVIIQNRLNQITYYSLKTLEKHLIISVQMGGEWLATTPNGQFTASLNGTHNAYWSLGDRFLQFEDLKHKYERPKLVKDALAGLFSGKAVIADEPIVEPEVLDAPFTVELVGENRVTTKADSHLLKVKVVKENHSVEDPTFFFEINSRRSRGFEEEPFFDGDEALMITRKVPLSIGDNEVLIKVLYRNVVVETLKATITRKSMNPEKLAGGNLWFFGVGISEYENTLQNLEYAHKDALSLAKLFKEQEGRLYEKVNTMVLTDRDATARNIKIKMNDFLREAKPDDTVILFIAGHGIQDENQDLYYMAHDGDIKRPYTGMPVADFRSFLDRRPLNQKAIFLMDICHAGTRGQGHGGRLTSEDVVKTLSDGTATIVFASSTGAQQSLEGEEFGGGHGAFTFALLDAMKGEADKTLGDQNGFTSLLETVFYTMREVPRITGQAQKPSIPIMSNVEDYPLTKVD